MNTTLTLLLSILCTLAATGQSQPDDAAWKALHQQAVNRPRRVIFNNDGNEPIYFCKAATAEDLLRARTTPLAGSHVDAIFYCTWSSGFGLFTHNTKVGQVFDTREAMFAPNRTREFLDKGLDPLAIMVDFAHRHNIELFWSMRMNDTHDASGAAYGPVMFRANRLKQEHPEWLIGSKEKRPKYGTWSSVDYAVPEIRDLAFRYCEEVCQNYAVDGIELDFFRHAFFFKCSGQGQPCGDEERGHMTGLLRRIRAMTHATGRKRGRPILLAVRVPDSVEYCRHIGLDLEKWLADGLVDLLIGSGYAQFNPWEYSVQLGHRYGVKVYPSLDESRVRDESARKLRSTLAAYRGRAMNVWASGADGVYLFNFFDPESPLWRELGDPSVLQKLDRTYFASIRGTGSMPVPHQKFIQAPILNPANPVSIAPDKPARIDFPIGETLPGGEANHPASSEGGHPARLGTDHPARLPNASTRITLRLQFKTPPDPKELRALLNGKALSPGRLRDNWLEFVLKETPLRQGTNTLELSTTPQQPQPLSLLDLYLEITSQATE